MAKRKAFAVYDTQVGAFLAPFFLQTAGQAVRSFMDASKDPNMEFSKHPGDYTLFELAEYDEETGKFTNLPTPHSLGTALQFVAQGSPEIRDLNGVTPSSIGEIRKAFAVQKENERTTQ